ncbi:MAG: matrixin family metalloprotease [Candidatus Bathyarchaeia archaeon]
MFIKEKPILCLLLVGTLLVGFASSAGKSALLQSSYSIELEEFRWTRFPLRVLVDMNQWSVPDYAVVVREALDDWMKSIWNYTQTFNDTSLPVVSYVFYVSNVNATQDYDVLVTFAPDKMPPGSSVVGLTTYDYDLATHEPVPPIIINATTSFATASSLFVKDVVMHEFGHALGLGHASSSSTLNGPELMYYASSKNEVVYSSTLDVYGFAELYRGVFNQSVQLPFDVPYVMLTEGTVPPPTVTPLVTSLWEDYEKYLPIVVVLLVLLVAAIVLARIGKEKSPEEPPQPLPPPPPV